MKKNETITCTCIAEPELKEIEHLLQVKIGHRSAEVGTPRNDIFGHVHGFANVFHALHSSPRLWDSCDDVQKSASITLG